MEDLDAMLKSLDFPVRKWQGHRRVIGGGRRLMPRKAGGSYEALNLESSSGTGEGRQ